MAGLTFGAITNFHKIKHNFFSTVGNIMFEQPDMVVNLSEYRFIYKEAFIKGIPSFGVTIEENPLVTYGLFGDMNDVDLQYVYLTFFISFRNLIRYSIH